MKTLIILRHADAAEKAAGGTDFDRSITEKGLRQASHQGGMLRQAGLAVERVVASSAVRAVATAEAFNEAAATGLEVEPVQALYNAPGEVLLEYVRGLDDGCATVVMVAHLPGVAQLVSLLVTEHVDLEPVFPAATLAVVQVDSDSWRDVDYGTGALSLLLPPFLPES